MNIHCQRLSKCVITIDQNKENYRIKKKESRKKKYLRQIQVEDYSNQVVDVVDDDMLLNLEK